MFSNKPSEFFNNFYKELLKTDIENRLLPLTEIVGDIIRNKEIKKAQEIIAVIKKIIKEPKEAKNKFYAMLVLVELMKSEESFVLDYFIKKLADRLSKIARYKFKDSKQNNLPKIGETCLDQ